MWKKVTLMSARRVVSLMYTRVLYIYIYIYKNYMTINLHFTSRKNIDKQNYTIARYQYTGKYLRV